MNNLQLTDAPVAKAAMLIRKPVAEVFEAFIDPAITSRFWFTKSTGRLEPGKHITWTWEMYDVSVEVHVKETDVFYIVDGTATFVTGGTVVGQKELRANQLTGADIQGGQTHQLKKGDFISIPAGTTHWFKYVALPSSNTATQRNLMRS